MTVAEFHCVRTGIVHGGIAATLCDTACGFAAHSLLPAGAYAISADLNVRYLRPVLVTSGTLTCTGTVKEINARTALAQAELADSDGALLAHATSTVLIRSTRPDRVWASPALFSDAAAAVILERDEDIDGLLLYSRDSQSFDGNTVTPSTLALLHTDHIEGNLAHDDVACFSVVGSGPERGTFIAPLRLPALQPSARV